MSDGFVLSCDANYFPGVAPLLRSLRSRHDEPVTFFDVGLTSEQRAALAPQVDRIVDLRDELDREVKILPGQHVTRSAFASLYCHLSGYDRIIYLDIDTLVLESLTAMFDALDSADIAGVRGNQFGYLAEGVLHSVRDEFTADGLVELAARFPAADLSLPAINTGCFAARARTFERFSVMSKELLDLSRHFLFVDQSLINLLILVEELELVLLPRTYNLMGVGFEDNGPRHASKIALDLSDDRPRLTVGPEVVRCVHFSGRVKPWSVQNGSPGSLAWRFFAAEPGDDLSRLKALNELGGARGVTPSSLGRVGDAGGGNHSDDGRSLRSIARTLVDADDVNGACAVLQRLHEADPADREVNRLLFEVLASDNLDVAQQVLHATRSSDLETRRLDRLVSALRMGTLVDINRVLPPRSFASLRTGPDAGPADGDIDLSDALARCGPALRARNFLCGGFPVEAGRLAQWHSREVWAPVVAAHAAGGNSDGEIAQLVAGVAGRTDWSERARRLEQALAARRFANLDHLLGRPAEQLSMLQLGGGFGEFAALAGLRQNRVVTAGGFVPLDASAFSFTSIDLDALESWPANAFDVVLAGDVLERVAPPDQVLRQLSRVVAPRGILLLTVRSIGLAAFCASEHLLDRPPYRQITLTEATEIAASAGLVNLRSCYAAGELFLVGRTPRPSVPHRVARRLGLRPLRPGRLDSVASTYTAHDDWDVEELWARVRERQPSAERELEAIWIQSDRGDRLAGRLRRYAAEHLVQQCAWPALVTWVDPAAEEVRRDSSGSPSIAVIDDVDEATSFDGPSLPRSPRPIAAVIAARWDLRPREAGAGSRPETWSSGTADMLSASATSSVLADLWPLRAGTTGPKRVLIHLPAHTLGRGDPHRLMQHIAMAQADQPPTSTEFTVLTERSVSAYARQFLRHAGLLAEVTAHEDLAISAIVRLMSSHDELVSPERDVLLGAEALGLVPTPLLTPVEDLHGGGAERDDVGRDTGVCADPSLATRARYAHIVEGLRAATEGLPE